MATLASQPSRGIAVVDAGTTASRATRREGANGEPRAELMTSWLADKASNTCEAYSADLALFLAWCREQGLHWPAVTPADIDAFIDVQRGVSGPTTVARRVAALASWYRHLVRTGHLPSNPLDDVARPSRARYGVHRRDLSVADLDRLRAQTDADIVAAAKPHPQHLYLSALCRAAILRLFIGTDFRPGCIVTLDVGAFDDDGRSAVLWLPRRNGASYRRHVPDDAAAAIQRYLTARAHMRGTCVQDLTGALFAASRGGTDARLGPGAPASMIRRIAAAAGLDDAGRVSPSTLRQAPGVAQARVLVERPPVDEGDVRARYLRQWVIEPLDRDPAVLFDALRTSRAQATRSTPQRPAMPGARHRVAVAPAPPGVPAGPERSSAPGSDAPHPAEKRRLPPFGRVRQLPRDVAPFPEETLRSYEMRLAAANHVSVRDLRDATGRRGPLDIAALCALTGRTQHAVQMALPELRADQQQADLPSAGRWPQLSTPQPTRSGRSMLIRPACRRCAAARGTTGDVLVWAPSEAQVCIRHRLWIGGRDPQGQWDVCDIPQVLATQRHHSNLVRRHGRLATRAAFSQAVNATAQWAQEGFWSEAALARRRALTGVADTAPLPDDPIVALLYYPEAVGLLSVFVSRYWIRVIGEQPLATVRGDAVLQRFYAEVRRRTGCDTTVGSVAAAGPLQQWCEQIEQRARTDRIAGRASAAADAAL